MKLGTSPRQILKAALIAIASTTACTQSDGGKGVNAGDASAGSDSGGQTLPTALADSVITTYKKLVLRTYQLSVEGAGKLETAVASFVAAPDAGKLAAAREAWLQSRLPYNQSDAFRFYEGPIDNEDDGPEAAINGWPLDENYVDYTRDAPAAGLIADPSKLPQPTGEALVALNEVGGEKNLATGYHAIEFLLWGQDEVTAGTGAGRRPHTDFVTGAGGTATHQDRRRAYLTAVTTLVGKQLGTVRDAWAAGSPDNYAAKFGVEIDADSETKDARKDAIGKIVRGLGSLARAELSGERMTVAFKNRDQEDEHSCFSDSTWLDLLGNAKGIRNVWTGSYEGEDLGPGLEDLWKAVDPALATKVGKDLDEAVAKLKTLADNNIKAPFDAVIAEADGSPNRVLMLDVMKALKRAADGFAEGAAAIGVKVAFEKPSMEL